MDVGRATQIGRWLFPALAGLLPVLGAVAPLGIAPLAGAAGLAAGWLLVSAGERRWLPRGAPAALFALLIAFAALSALWAVDGGATLARVPKLAALVIAGGLVIAAAAHIDTVTRNRVMAALAGGIMLALLPPLADRLLEGAISNQAPWIHNRGLSVLALLIWPASLLLRARPRVIVALWAAALVVTFALNSDAAKIALVFGLIAAGLGRVLPRATPVLIATLLIAYIAAAPTIHGRIVTPHADGETLETVRRDWPFLSRSAYHRLLIWEFAAARIADKPALGWGFDGARRLPGGTARFDIPDQAMPLHPHNAVLQLWVELGAGGAALAAALVFWTALRLRRIADRAASAAATGYVTAAITLLCLTFGIWQSWWLAALFLSTALLAAALPRAR